MKKLVALLVICLVSVVANAALVGDLTMVGNVVSLNITGSPADPFFAIAVKGSGTLGGFAAPALAGSDVAGAMAATFADLGQDAAYGNGEVWTFTDSSVPYAYPNGTWLTAVLSGVIAETGAVVTAYQFDSGTSEFVALDSVEIPAVVVPEPITVALLGLGGLFLRRKIA